MIENGLFIVNMLTKYIIFAVNCLNLILLVT